MPPVSWQAVRLYFGFLNLVALGIIGYWAYALGRPLGRWHALFLLGVANALVANLFSISAGQYSIIVNSLLIASLLFYNKRLDVLAGLALGIAMVKPQIAGLFFLAFLVKARWRIVLAATGYVVVATLLTSWWIHTNPVEMSLQMWQASHQWIATGGGYSPLKFMLLADPGNRYATGGIALTGMIAALVLMSLCRKCSILLLFAIAAVLGRMWTYHNIYDNTMLLFLLVYLGVASVRDQPKIQSVAVFLLVGATLWSPVTYTGHGFLPLQIAHLLIWLLGLLTVLSLAKREAFSVDSHNLC